MRRQLAAHRDLLIYASSDLRQPCGGRGVLRAGGRGERLPLVGTVEGGVEAFIRTEPRWPTWSLASALTALRRGWCSQENTNGTAGGEPPAGHICRTAGPTAWLSSVTTGAGVVGTVSVGLLCQLALEKMRQDPAVLRGERALFSGLQERAVANAEGWTAYDAREGPRPPRGQPLPRKRQHRPRPEHQVIADEREARHHLL